MRLSDLPDVVLLKIFGDGYLTAWEVVQCSKLDESMSSWFYDTSDDGHVGKSKTQLWKRLLHQECLPGTTLLDLTNHLELWDEYCQELRQKSYQLSGAYNVNNGNEMGPPDDETKQKCREFLLKAINHYTVRVANSHSWYKHLPIAADACQFAFYCDLISNMFKKNGEFVEFTEDDGTRFHYTWMTTEKFRQKFGNFRYEQHSGTSRRRQVAKRVNGESVFIPKSACAPTVSVTAVIHNSSPRWCHYEEVLKAAINLRDPKIVFHALRPEWVQRHCHHIKGGKLPYEVANDLSAIALGVINESRRLLHQVMEERFILPYQSNPLFTMDCMPKQHDDVREWAVLASVAQRHRELTAIRRSLHELCIRTYGAELVPSMKLVENQASHPKRRTRPSRNLF